MSPSWTSLFSPGATVRIGLAIGRDRVCAVAPGDPARGEAAFICEQALPVALFSGAPAASHADALGLVLRGMAAQLPRRGALVRVAVPDVVIRSTVFELDDLPRRQALRETLVRWRFATLWQRAQDSLDGRAQALGPAQDKHLLLGQAGDRAWLDLVRQALGLAGFASHTLNAAAIYRFNHVQAGAAGRAAGTLLTLDPECWSLLRWDATGRPRHIHSRLRQTAAPADDIGVIAAEAWRILQAPGHEVAPGQPLQVMGAAGEASAMALALAAWMPVAPVVSEVRSDTPGASPRLATGPAQLALIAALDA